MKKFVLATVLLSQSSLVVLNANAKKNVIHISADDVDINDKTIEMFSEQNKELAEALENADEDEYDDYITDFMNNTDTILLDETLDYLSNNIDSTSTVAFDDELVDEYIISDDTSIVFTPTDIFLDSYSESEEEVVLEE